MLLLKLIEILPHIGSHSGDIRALRFIGSEGKVLERGGSEALDEGSEVVGDTELLEIQRRGGGRRSGGGGGDGVGEGLDLVGLAEGGGLEDVGLLGGLGGELFGFLGRFGDEIGDARGGRSEGLGFLRRLFGEGLGALPEILHWWHRRREKEEREREEEGYDSVWEKEWTA